MQATNNLVQLELQEANDVVRQMCGLLKTKDVSVDIINRHMDVIVAHLVLMVSQTVSLVEKDEEFLLELISRVKGEVYLDTQSHQKEQFDEIKRFYARCVKLLKEHIARIYSQEKIVKQQKRVVIQNIASQLRNVIDQVKECFNGSNISLRENKELFDLFKWFKTSIQTVQNTAMIALMSPLDTSKKYRQEMNQLLDMYKTSLQNISMTDTSSVLTSVWQQTQAQLQKVNTQLNPYVALSQKQFVETVTQNINIDLPDVILERKLFKDKRVFDEFLDQTLQRIKAISSELTQLDSKISSRKTQLSKLLKALAKRVVQLQNTIDRSYSMLAGVSAMSYDQISYVISDLSSQLKAVTRHCVTLQQEKDAENQTADAIIGDVQTVQLNVQDLIKQLASLQNTTQQNSQHNSGLSQIDVLLSVKDFLSNVTNNCMNQLTTNQAMVQDCEERLMNECDLLMRQLTQTDGIKSICYEIKQQINNSTFDFSQLLTLLQQGVSFFEMSGSQIRFIIDKAFEKFVIGDIGDVSIELQAKEPAYRFKLKQITYQMIKLRLESNVGKDYEALVHQFIEIQTDWLGQIKDLLNLSVKISDKQKRRVQRVQDIVTQYKSELDSFLSLGFDSVFKDVAAKGFKEQNFAFEEAFQQFKSVVDQIVVSLSVHSRRFQQTLQTLDVSKDTYDQISITSDATVVLLTKLLNELAKNTTDVFILDSLNRADYQVIQEMNETIVKAKDSFKQIFDEQRKSGSDVEKQVTQHTGELRKKIQRFDEYVSKNGTSGAKRDVSVVQNISAIPSQTNLHGGGQPDFSPTLSSDTEQVDSTNKDNAGVKIAVAAALILAIGCGLIYVRKRTRSVSSNLSNRSDRSNSSDRDFFD